MVNIHLKGTFFLTQKLLPLIHDGGPIVNISSGLMRLSIPEISAYATMRAAVAFEQDRQSLLLASRSRPETQ